MIWNYNVLNEDAGVRIRKKRRNRRSGAAVTSVTWAAMISTRPLHIFQVAGISLFNFRDAIVRSGRERHSDSQ